jgi:diguanylate cyclase (GGDEF)-like protein
MEQGSHAQSTTKPAKPNALRTLTTAREVHSLTIEEARRPYPVHLRAVVTYFDREGMRGGMFIHDATGGIYAAYAIDGAWPKGPPLPGTLIDISGTSAPGDFAPVVDHSVIRIIGPSHLPLHATPVTLSRLLTGTEDCQWVEIEGVVRSVMNSNTNVTLEVATADGIIGAVTPNQLGVDYNRLVDATVWIHGDAAALFNPKSMQMTGSHLYFPGLRAVTVVEPGRPEVLAEPPRTLSSLSRFTPTLAWPHRVHLRGTVTLHWPGRNICIEDDTQGLCAQSRQTTPLAVGSSADLGGFTALAGFRPSLDDAIFQAAPGTRIIAIPVITSDQALKGDHDSELVTIKGRLIGRERETRDTILVLESEKSIFRAVLPSALANSYLSSIRTGSTLSITGICAVQLDSLGTLQSHAGIQASRFSVLLRSPRDVVVLHAASWWTETRLGMLVLFGLVISLAASVWVIVLRYQVELKTTELRESRELYRHMAHHDVLTGLHSRALLQDHLQIGLERFRRFKKGLALLMLDLDNFKQINDSHGHDTGDQVLRITAHRLSSMIRKTDSIGRLGGDEFVVILNDLENSGQAEMVAGKIVAALALPIQIGELQIPITVSIGVCTLSDSLVDAETLLKRVDAAMYRAKARGRARFDSFTDDMIQAPANQSPAAPTFQPDLADQSIISDYKGGQG